MTKIHVIIPVYNAKKYLREAVDSVLNQPYKNIDIVLVNDGSTDGSAELCDEIVKKEERVSVIHQTNTGVSAARNAGIEFVLNKGIEGAYLAFLDADDVWTSCFWNGNNIALLEKGYSVVGFQSCRCNSLASRRSMPKMMTPGVHLGGADNVWIHSHQTFGAMLYSARHLSNYTIRFFNGLKNNEDRIFTMQCLYLADEIYLENHLLYLYRNNSSSTSHQKRNAIDKYMPMIEAYMKSDKMMDQWKTERNGCLRQGHVMAAIYVIDMIEEYWQQFGKKKEIDKLLADRTDLLFVMNSPEVWRAQNTCNRWNKFVAHPRCLQVQCYLRGLRKKFMYIAYTLLYKEKHIAAIIDKKRYPVMIEK